jgi:GTP:adenosylcobinamide-phosphate guanylyltransferase
MDRGKQIMHVVIPINGRNERMGSLFKTSKHLLLYRGKQLLLHTIDSLKYRFPNCEITILTNDFYARDIQKVCHSNANVIVISPTSSQVETLKTFTTKLSGAVLFVDCDIVPTTISEFDTKFTTVFAFENTTKLLNYSNFKSDKNNNIVDCNEKQKLFKYAGAGVYYFSDVELFNAQSENCNNVSECVQNLILNGEACKLNTTSIIERFGTLQDIYIDNFSFRTHKQKDLSTGFTDNKVYKYRNTVVKIGSTVSNEYEWYKSYTDKKHIPNIISCADGKMTMEYIHRNNDFNLDDVFELVSNYKSYARLNDLTFDSYIENIKRHLNDNSNITNGDKLISHLSNLNIEPTFCHGDLSVMNLIPTTNGIKMIDPLYSRYKFGSYQLDLAKLCFSFKFYKNDSASFNYIKQQIDIKYIDVLIAAESVRVASYKKEYSFISENLINEII